MFTIKQIESAHAKVKSGSDFPSYVKEINELGVMHYETFVDDGHTDFYDSNGQKVSSNAKYPELNISDICDVESFKKGLKEHQQGKTDYLNFIEMCALNGITGWIVSIMSKTCYYYDKRGNEILVEQIPL